MSVKKRGLGRGLDALLGLAGDAVLEEPAATRAVEHIAIDRIRKGRYQPRLDLRPEGLQELADSIRAQGVVQPVVVRPLGDGRPTSSSPANGAGARHGWPVWTPYRP